MALTPVILIIAGTDSSGGAGIARDVETAVHSGVSAALTVTSVTAQTHNSVLHVKPIHTRLIAEQITTAFAANTVRAVKIGMLGTKEAARTVSFVLKQYNNIPVIFDPVLAASAKGKLSRGNMREAIMCDLLPRITLITPNLPELGYLTRTPPAEDDTTAIEQGKTLLRLGAHAVLVKGGHAQGEMSTDYLLLHNQEPINFSHKRVAIAIRGTGCALSTAIAANMALGLPLDEATTKAKQYISALFTSKG